MQKIEYTFQINTSDKIVIIVNEDTEKEITYDSWGMPFLIANQIKKVITYEPFHVECRNLSVLLKKAIKHKLALNEIQIPDIGYFSNEALYNSIVLNQDINNDVDKYNLWWPRPNKGNIESWIYNNSEGEIIFCITPLYPFFYCRRPKKHPSYEEWIKTYQPLARYVISKHVAKKWIKQANDIMALIETNNKRISHGGFRSPKNGQKALDNSIAYKESSSARVSLSDGECVILIKAKGDVSHGHVAAWNELELAMQDALENAKLVTSYGRIICKN